MNAGMKEIGERLRALRLEKGLTQTKLSEASGVSQRDISKYESGGRGNMTIRSLSRLARTLDVSLDYLVWGENQ